MDYQAVGSPTHYGAPNVFQQQQPAQGQAAQGAPQGQQGPNPQIMAALAKAKQLLSSGQMSPDQYTNLTTQLQGMGGNMGAGMPGSASAAPPGQPLNIMPGGGQ